MKKRLFLTSLVAVGCVCPIFAARANAATESFPSNGLMLEDKTYANAATYNNVGAYSGYVTAEAQYVNTLQQLIGGTYLPAGAMVAEQCPANSYCPGMTDATINANESQGATSCPSDYPNSAVGASAITQCYTACTLKSANIEHAKAVSGNDYYGDGTDTCFATECEMGYHVYETVKVIEQTPLIDVENIISQNVRGADIDGNGDMTTEGGDTYGLTEKNTWAMKWDAGVAYGRASCQATTPQDYYSVIDGYMNENGEAIMAGTKSLDQVRSDLTPILGAALANYVADLFARQVNGDPVSEEESRDFMIVLRGFDDASFSTTDTGEYCYCQITGVQSAQSGESGYDISKAIAVESAPWVPNNTHSSGCTCASCCARFCRYQLINGDAFSRYYAFGTFRVTDVSTCDANEIEIRWSDAAEEDIAANNAGMCTYGGDIRTPIKAATIPGKTFVGWKFLPQEH